MSIADGASAKSVAASFLVNDSGGRGDDALGPPRVLITFGLGRPKAISRTWGPVSFTAILNRMPAGLSRVPWTRGPFSAAPTVADSSIAWIGALITENLGEATTRFFTGTDALLSPETPLVTITATEAIFPSDGTYGTGSLSRRDFHWPAG